MPNPYRALIDLLPQADQLNVGAVESVNTTANTTTLTLMDDSTIVVRGTELSVGDKAFYRNGIIEGKAPDLPVYEIEV